jgi:hypothetical protein
MRQPIPDDVVALPTAFVVGDHDVVVAQVMPAWRWTTTVDGRLLDGTFQTQAEAWEAGVRDADRVDSDPTRRGGG